MDFDLVLYIAVIVGSVIWSIVKKANKEEQERQAKKNVGRPRPVIFEPDSPAPEQSSRPRANFTPEKNAEPFSYETMSERDFEQAFAQNAESNLGTSHPGAEPAINLSMNEEEVFKGVVWSEILKRKY